MQRSEVIERIRSAKKRLKEEFGIEELGLFGSRARGDANESSDIDLLILKSRKKDYFIRISAKYFLEELLQKRVDLGYYDAIRPVIRKRIEKDLIYV
ncbi:nucleotidyltransferase family protein [Nitratifractor sp.]